MATGSYGMMSITALFLTVSSRRANLGAGRSKLSMGPERQSTLGISMMGILLDAARCTMRVA